MNTAIKTRFVAAAAIGVLALSGCAGMNQTQKDTATGAGIGASIGSTVSPRNTAAALKTAWTGFR